MLSYLSAVLVIVSSSASVRPAVRRVEAKSQVQVEVTTGSCRGLRMIGGSTRVALVKRL